MLDQDLNLIFSKSNLASVERARELHFRHLVRQLALTENNRRLKLMQILDVSYKEKTVNICVVSVRGSPQIL